jgi:hypothetical protein
MSRIDTRTLARQFMEEQKRILEEYGDSVVFSKYKNAVTSAEKTFGEMCQRATQRTGRFVEKLASRKSA